jgi:exodeoxyribonuclease V alpha subunit
MFMIYGKMNMGLTVPLFLPFCAIAILLYCSTIFVPPNFAPVYMQTLNDVHQQFAEYFDEPDLKPYLYALSRKMSEGHICIFTKEIDLTQLPESYQNIAGRTISTKGHLVGPDEESYKPFVLDGERLYLHRYFHYETQLLQNIAARVNLPDEVKKKREEDILNLKDFISNLFYNETAKDIDWQLAAAITAVLNNFTIITGGPGTGKTTTVAKMLAILFSIEPGLKVALAAPTGKAGARMAESLMNTKIDAGSNIASRFAVLQPATIHRLLGWQKGTPYFKHNAANPLPYDLVVIDESSMIDVALFAKLLDALRPDARIILLGDKDQLASVEAGSLFGDLCKAIPELNLFDAHHRSLINSFITQPERQLPATFETEDTNHLLYQHLIELRYSHRFSNDEGIGRLSRAVIQNDTEVLQQFLDRGISERVQIDQQYDSALFETFAEGYKAYIETEDIREALNRLNDLRILCAVRQGEQGVYNLNAMVEAYLIKTGKIRRDSEFYLHRPVMVTQNDYTLGLYNGDTGILRPDENGVMKAWFIDATEGREGRLKAVLPGFITQMETVFAMTIHKSQGSEFGKVMVVLPRKTEFQMLTRELLYTGITRARNEVIIQSDAETLLAAAAALVERGSGVAERLAEF